MMSLPDKHNPVLLKEVLDFFTKVSSCLDSVLAIDCTLGQGGHSYALFKNISRGILISVEKNKTTFEWAKKYYGFSQENSICENDRKWFIYNSDFTSLDRLVSELGYAKFDFLIADLGFSNFELKLNLGFSYSKKGQILDMRYGDDGIPAYEILNKSSHKELTKAFIELGQINDHLASNIATEILQYRSGKSFYKVKDLNSALKSFPKGVLIKVYQALKILVNEEKDKINWLTSFIVQNQSGSGASLIITFNPYEEFLVSKYLPKYQIVEPNISEMIKNTQSRSAKMYVYQSK